MSSKEELRNPLDKNGWPKDNMTIEENLADLREHQEEFLKREAFTYTVVSLDESKCLGCVYIYPSEKGSFDAGTKFQYSNFNDILLGYIIKKVSGMKYQEFNLT